MSLPHLPHHQGWIEVVVGPMFSGKSDELIRRIKRALIARQRVLVFKPLLDDRYHVTDVFSHDADGLKLLQCATLPNSRRIYPTLCRCGSRGRGPVFR